MNRLINIPLVALLLFAAMSCSKDESVRVAPQGQEITFDMAQTRATYSSLADIDEFGVYAVMSDAPDDNYDQPSDVVYTHIISGADGKGARVYWDENIGADGGFTYDNVAYWFDERTFHFFGYWPYSTPAEIAGDGYSYMLDFAVEAAAKPEDQTANDDLLTFHYTTAYSNGNATTVNVEFAHILSKITFSISQDFVKNPYDVFHVNSVTLSNIKAGGTYTTSRYNRVGSWNYSNVNISFKETFNADVQFTPAPPGSNDLVVFEDLKLVPQTITSNQIGLVVDYTYRQGDIEGNLGEEQSKTARVFLPIGQWLPNKAYNYKMTLYQDNLLVFRNIDISPWGEQPDAGTIIIK